NLAYVQIDLVGLFTAAAGSAIYEGGAWPSNWTYSYFTTEPTINIVHHEVVTPDGPTFTANKVRDEEFIGGRDKWFRPIETRVGPDGALYIIDFYNQAVIHNDTRGPKHNGVNAAVRPDRDHYFGRIWRVQHKQAQPVAMPPDLAKASPSNLVAALDHPNRPVAFTAHRLIYENTTPEVVAAMKARPTANEPSGPVHRLWLMAGARDLPVPILMTAMADDRAPLRKNAMRVAAVTLASNSPNAALKRSILSKLNDPDAGVQLEAIVALGSFAVDEAMASALVKIYPTATNAWVESAIAGVASKDPLPFVNAALVADSPGEFRDFVDVLTAQVAQRAERDPEQAAALVITAANAPA